jgi:general secretion pathway protein J
MKPSRGFTLIELLVAMAIVAIVGVIALTGINTVIDQQAIAAERSERWREIQFAMRVLVQDLSEVHPRVTRDEQGLDRRPSFLADPTHQYALEFSRGGWTNRAGFKRGTVLRVAYDIENDMLVRFYWPVADRTLSTPPVRNELLTGIVDMQMQFFDADGNASLDWPPLEAGGGVSPTSRPRAVEIELTLEDLGLVWRLIEITS